MQKYLLVACIAFLMLSCRSGTAEVMTSPTVSTELRRGELLETFSDDAGIGVPGRNKIELRSYSASQGSSFVEIKFYSRTEDNAWGLKQSFEFEKNSLIYCDPHLKDFNNDGLKDLTYISNVAARGANEVRRLFIYDKERDELLLIKNSDDYPNLEYNEKLDCVDAWLFHGATTTVFLKIEGDMLRKFASVDTGAERIVTVLDKDGKERILSRRKMNEDEIYMRYSSFDPPE